MPRIYTKTGDDGTTGLLYGGRVSKADLVPEACGTIDEAVALIGLARAHARDDGLRDELLEHVWGSTAKWQEAATVTEHVRRVRQRLGERPED